MQAPQADSPAQSWDSARAEAAASPPPTAALQASVPGAGVCLMREPPHAARRLAPTAGRLR